MLRLAIRSSSVYRLRGGIGNFSSYTTFDRLVNFKKAIVEDIDLYRYEGIPESSNEFTQKRDKLDTTIEVGKSILAVGKVPYRWVDHPSFYYQAKLAAICKGKRPSQIRRLLKDGLVEKDRDISLSYVSKNLEWNNSTEPKSTPMVYSQDDVISYSHYFMSARYSVVKKVLNEIRVLLPSFIPKNVLDFGCGPGTCLPAILEAFDSAPKAKPATNSDYPDARSSATTQNLIKATITPNPKSVVKRYVGVDIDINMLSAAKVMATGTGLNCAFFNKTSDLVSLVSESPTRFDLVTAAYVFSDMVSDATRKAAAQLLVELLEVNGCLVIIENGDPQGSHTVRTARQFILDAFNRKFDNNNNNTDNLSTKMLYAFPPPLKKHKGTIDDVNPESPPTEGSRFDHNDLGVSIVAPCSHDAHCPLGRSICAFSQKVSCDFAVSTCSPALMLSCPGVNCIDQCIFRVV